MHHYNFRLCSKLSARAKTKTIFSEMDIDFAKDSFIMPSQPMLSSPLKRKSAVVDRQELPSSEYFPQLCNNRKKTRSSEKEYSSEFSEANSNSSITSGTGTSESANEKYNF